MQTVVRGRIFACFRLLPNMDLSKTRGRMFQRSPHTTPREIVRVPMSRASSNRAICASTSIKWSGPAETRQRLTPEMGASPA